AINYVSIDGENIEDVESISLTPGQVLVAEANYEVSQADVDSGVVNNEATVHGTPPNSDEPVTDTDAVSVPQDVEGGLTLDKSSEVPEVVEVGSNITYNFLVTNTSNVTLSNLVLDDEMLGGSIDLESTELAPGEETRGTQSYTVTQADVDAGNIHNIATVTGEDPRGGTPTAEDDDEVPIESNPSIEENPAITLEKTSDVANVTEVGQIVNYNFVISNTGDTKLSNIILNDPMLGGEIKLEVTELEVGESFDLSVEHTVTNDQFKYSTITNTAIVSGVSPENKLVFDTDDTVITTDSLIEGEDPTGLETNKTVNG